MSEPGRALARLGADRIHLDAREQRNARRLKADAGQMATDLSIVLGRALENRDFDAVIARALDRVENRPVLMLNMRRPQQQIKADFHDALPDR
jgi:hypothetical protein